VKTKASGSNQMPGITGSVDSSNGGAGGTSVTGLGSTAPSVRAIAPSLPGQATGVTTMPLAVPGDRGGPPAGMQIDPGKY
jgi:hypothetical protein